MTKNTIRTGRLVSRTALCTLGILAATTCIVSAGVMVPKVVRVSSENPHGMQRDANNTVNGSGLDDGGEHVAGEEGVVWTTIGATGATDFAPYIVYDLGAPMDVTAMRVWNYNSALVVKGTEPADGGAGELSTLTADTTLSIAGADLVALSTSVDGTRFISRGTVHVKQAPGRNGYEGQRIPLDYKQVRYIRLDIKTNHDGAVFGGTGAHLGVRDKRGLTGLSEVRFESVDLIERRVPGDALLVHEGGETTRYDIRLMKKPRAQIRIKAVPSDREIGLNDALAGMAVDISMDQTNWDKWKKITVRAEDDKVFDPGHTSAIRHYLVTGHDPETVTDLGAELHVSVQDNEDHRALNTGEDIDVKDPVKRMEWWQDAKYYWFIHWNPVSLTGTEISWARGGAVPKDAYDNLYKKFNPTDFDADEWVRIAKAAGFKTLVITTKHHDGFCMWDTKTTDYNIMNTPFGRDVVKELADACKRQNFRFSIYYSIMDWYHPDWPHYFAGGPGYALPAGEKPDVNRYINYMNEQIRELLTNYGPVHMIWWDGTDGRPQFAPPGVFWTKETAGELETLTRSLQPAVVMNNRVGLWNGNDIGHHWWIDEFGDYDSSEMGLSGFNVEKPWEYTFTLGTQWAWRSNDHYKSTRQMVQSLVGIAGRGGNLLLNVSPPATGQFEERVVERLTDIGNWLRHYGESVYGTRGGPYKPGSWGVSTHKDNKIYLHVLNRKGTSLELPAINKTITKSWVLTGGEVNVTQTKDKVVIDVPAYDQREIDTIVVLELDGPAMEIAPVDTL